MAKTPNTQDAPVDEVTAEAAPAEATVAPEVTPEVPAVTVVTDFDDVEDLSQVNATSDPYSRKPKAEKTDRGDGTTVTNYL